MNQNVTTSAFETERPQLSTAEAKCMEDFPLSASACAGMTQTTLCDRKQLPSIVSKGELWSPLEVAEVMLILTCIRFAELQVTVGCEHRMETLQKTWAKPIHYYKSPAWNNSCLSLGLTDWQAAPHNLLIKHSMLRKFHFLFHQMLSHCHS